MPTDACGSFIFRLATRAVVCLLVSSLLLVASACVDLRTDSSATPGTGTDADIPSTDVTTTLGTYPTVTTIRALATKDADTTTSTLATLPTIAGMNSVTPIGQSSWTRFEETDSRMYWEGWWAPSVEPAASAGRCMSIDSMGFFYARFQGTRVALVAGKHPEYGYLRLWVRGPSGHSVPGLEGVYVDLYSPDESWERVWTSPVFDYGIYELHVEWTHAKNEAAGGTRITIDAVDVVGDLLSL